MIHDIIFVRTILMRHHLFTRNIMDLICKYDKIQGREILGPEVRPSVFIKNIPQSDTWDINAQTTTGQQVF